MPSATWSSRTSRSAAASKAEYALDGWNPAKAGATGQSGWDTWALLDGNNANALEVRYLNGDGIDQHLARINRPAMRTGCCRSRMGSIGDVVEQQRRGDGCHRLRRLGQHPQRDELEQIAASTAGTATSMTPTLVCTRRRRGCMTRRRGGGFRRIRRGLMRAIGICIGM